jgi:DNA mismatch repair protein MutS
MKESLLLRESERIKEQHPNALVWFECQGFIEIVGQDAIDTANLLDIILTLRPDDGLHLTGFTSKTLDENLRIVVNSGRTVALVQDAVLPVKTVKRKIR